MWFWLEQFLPTTSDASLLHRPSLISSSTLFTLRPVSFLLIWLTLWLRLLPQVHLTIMSLFGWLTILCRLHTHDNNPHLQSRFVFYSTGTVSDSSNPIRLFQPLYVLISWFHNQLPGKWNDTHSNGFGNWNVLPSLMSVTRPNIFPSLIRPSPFSTNSTSTKSTWQ